jgi:hypothetical protein
MTSRWYSIAVVGLWLTTMTWLVNEKVLPPLRIGEPPNYLSIVESQESQPPIGWGLWIDGKQRGWARSETLVVPDEIIEVRSHLHFDEMPLAEFWQWRTLQLLSRVTQSEVGTPKIDADNVVVIDPLGGLMGFTTVLRMQSQPDAIRVDGKVDGTKLKLSIYPKIVPDMEVPLPPKALVGGALSPQTSLPKLRIGQTWTVPAFHPGRPTNPMEILQAAVERKELMQWDGQLEEVLVVVYRPDPGEARDSDKSPRGQVWVRHDGTILKQEIKFFGSTLTFLRMTDEEAAALPKTADNQQGATDGRR